MKKLFIITFLLSIIIILIPACSKEEINPEIVPTASFTVSSYKVFVNDTVKFTNKSSDAQSFLWNFGDGEASTITSPTHSYKSEGNYTVKLTAYSPSRLKTNESTAGIQVIVRDPVASFTMSSNSVYVNDTVKFTNTSTNASRYKWDFGDGKTSTETSPTHIYNNAGNYTVKLTAYSADGTKSDEQTESIKVNNYEDPVAMFTMSSDEVFVKETVTFTNTSTNAESYSWDFGDGKTSTKISPTHIYNEAGDYTVKLTATSADGTKHDTHTEAITVNALPVADFTYSPTTIYVNIQVSFINASTNATGYVWDFGDGQTSTEVSPSHTYASVGSYTVTLTAKSGTESDTHTEELRVEEATSDPVAGFTYTPTAVYINDVVTFTNTSTNAASYLWDFGDGQTSTEVSPNHTYINSGICTVKLMAYSADGTKSDEQTESIKVLHLPKASFVMSSNEVIVDETVIFINKSINAASYLWDFGDGETSQMVHPTHSYSNSGYYTVKLTAYSADGLKSDETTKNINVLPYGTWIYYDDGTYASSVGANGSPMYWGISFPNTGEYAGMTLTKIAYYEQYEATITANIYLGGTTAPGTLVATQDFTCGSSGSIIEINLDTPVAIDGTQLLWITCFNSGIDYPASGCAYCGDLNSCWVSLDGALWEPVTNYGLDYTWILRGYVTNDRGETMILSPTDNKDNFK